MGRARVRDLGIAIGQMPTGSHNAITDVPGVLVGHRTLIWDTPRMARTGVTMVIPRGGAVWRDPVFAAHHSFNGNGEMTGLVWLEEAGLLDGPIGITNTHAVGWCGTRSWATAWSAGMSRASPCRWWRRPSTAG